MRIQKIQLFKRNGHWQAQFIDNGWAMRMFGLSILQLAFNDKAPQAMVKAEVEILNPGVSVEVIA